MGTDSSGRAIRRYTVAFRMVTSDPREDQRREIRAATSLGVHKAVAMATARLLRLDPEARVSDVDIVDTEDEFTVDVQHDAIDYHGGFD